MIKTIAAYWRMLVPSVPKDPFTKRERLLYEALEKEEKECDDLKTENIELERKLAQKADLGPLKFVRSAWPEGSHGVTVYFTDQHASGHFLALCQSIVKKGQL